MNRRNWLRLAAAAIPGLASFRTRLWPSPPFRMGPGAMGPAGDTPLTADRSPLTAPDRLGPIGVQLYTVRDAMAKAFEDTLTRVAAVGYRQVEFAGYFDRTPKQVRSALDAAGLEAPSAHIPMADIRTRWRETIDAALTVGHRYLVCPWIDEGDRKTLDGLKSVAEEFNKAAETARAAGIQFAYHNHEWEFAPLEGRLPYDVLLEAADPKLVQFEMDIYWITHGGGDPLAYFARYPGRFPMVHAKDMDAGRNMVAVGKGTIDFGAIFHRRSEAGIRYVFVEHDNPADAFQSIRQSYEYLRHLEF
jgi:sugar phosphate isomerase/epimerase